MNELVLAEAEVSRLLGFCQRDAKLEAKSS